MVKLTPCGCGARNLVRIDRSFWMRLVPTRRYYFCPVCRSNQFLSRKAVTRALLSAPPPAVVPSGPREVEAVTRQPGDSLDSQATLPARFL